MLVVLLATLAVAVTVGLAVGPVTIAPSTVLRILTYRVLGGGILSGEVTWTVLQDDIVWNLRLPRVRADDRRAERG